MTRGKRIAAAVALAAYLSAGLAVSFCLAPDEVEPKAGVEDSQAFAGRLQADSLKRLHRREAKHDSLQKVWQAERMAREALREHRLDSARRYWDGVRRQRDSVRAVRDSIRARRDALYAPRKTDVLHPVNLATATADSLRLIPGIGAVLSARIEAYRDRLGGFVSLSQVLEIEHVPEEALAYMTLPSVSVRTLNVNRATPQRLRSHPYISGTQAVAICEARRKHGSIAGWHELLRLPQFSAYDEQRLKPYMEF